MQSLAFQQHLLRDIGKRAKGVSQGNIIQKPPSAVGGQISACSGLSTDSESLVPWTLETKGGEHDGVKGRLTQKW